MRSAFTKTGTIIAGGLVGALATTAMAGDYNTLISVGDMGTYQSATPDGNSDQVWVTGTNGTNNGVVFNYLANNGLNIQDTSGQVTDITVNTNGGSGYGQNCTSLGTGGTTTNGTIFQSDGRTSGAGWWAPAVFDNTGSGGANAQGSYQIDGPAGGVYFDGNSNADTRQQDFEITNGSTGYMPGATNATYAGNVNAQNSLSVTISTTGGSLGSFGFLTDSFVVTGANGIIDTYSAGQLSPSAAGFARNSTLRIVNDNATTGPKGTDEYGNYRLYLGATPAAANGNAVAGAATQAGQVANLAIVGNGFANNDSTSANRNATSGIGYTAGNFMIYDADGNLVSGIEIAYEVDSEGRIYTGYKGAWNGNVNTTTGAPDQTTINRNWNNTNGWSITRNNANLSNTAGYTVVPQGDGTGFVCNAIHLYGQVINMQSMCTNASFDTTGTPRLTITRNGTGVVPTSEWAYTMSAPHSGTIIDGSVRNGGQSYVAAPAVTTAAGDTGVNGKLAATLGSVGLRTVTVDGADLAFDAVTPMFDCFSNGDFNGDGYSDLVWDSVEYGCYIWNMGSSGEVISFGELPKPGGAWELVGLGGFDSDITGCGMFWYNTETGQTAAWWVNTTGAASTWIVGSAELDTVVDAADWSARCTNNGTLNSGNSVYWHNSASGEIAYWPVTINANGSTPSLGSGYGMITLSGSDILLPGSDGWKLVASANMAGRPTADDNIQRDLVWCGDNGQTAIWLMDSTSKAIDTTLPGDAAGGGRGLTSYLGSTTIQSDAWAGVGLYNVAAIYTTNPASTPGAGFRQQQFACMNWTNGYNAATWKMDRNLDLIDYTAAASARGNGLCVAPYTVSAATTR
ncbi:MAG: hypothetical protein CMJ40_08495 [Phycisphaerae bacterium]|nr:hypothetical protein [Phycisphaerae bacterium]